MSVAPARAVENPYIFEALQDINDRLRFVRLAVATTPHRVQTTAGEHLMILDAVEKKRRRRPAASAAEHQPGAQQSGERDHAGADERAPAEAVRAEGRGWQLSLRRLSVPVGYGVDGGLLRSGKVPQS